jgi:hypothetical protein
MDSDSLHFVMSGLSSRKRQRLLEIQTKLELNTKCRDGSCESSANFERRPWMVGGELPSKQTSSAPAAIQSWISRRLFVWLDGIPNHSWCAIVSSRIGKAPDQSPAWFDYLRTIVAGIDIQRQLLVYGAGTAVAPFVERCGELFQVNRLCITLPSEGQSWDKWLNDLYGELKSFTATNPDAWNSPTTNSTATDGMSATPPASDESCSQNLWRLWISPEIPSVDGESASSGQSATSSDTQQKDVNLVHAEPFTRIEIRPSVPNVTLDSLLISLADQVIAINIRSGGNIEQAIVARLQTGTYEPGTVWVAAHDELIAKKIRNNLLALGAASLWLYEPPKFRDSPRTLDKRTHRLQAIQRSVSEKSVRNPSKPNAELLKRLHDLAPYLVHCTRRRAGPWPDQTATHFLDDLILAMPERDHSAFSAVIRILRQKRLVGTAEMTRGDSSMVCWSEQPLLDFLSQRAWRSHLSRWDYEPFGICVRRERLESQGAKPVIYGDDSTWQSMTESERPWFQAAESRSRSGELIADWRLEKEWRVPIAVDLSQIQWADALVFVETPQQADALNRFSPWPVVSVADAIKLQSYPEQ